MSQNRNVRTLGQKLIARGLITEDQLNEALVYQKENNVLVGEALIGLGYLTSGQLAAFIQADKNAPIGEVLIERGYLNREKLNRALDV